MPIHTVEAVTPLTEGERSRFAEDFWSRRRFAPASALEGTGFETIGPASEKWSMPSSSDQTRVGRTLILGGGAESSLEAETSGLGLAERHPYFAL